MLQFFTLFRDFLPLLTKKVIYSWEKGKLNQFYMLRRLKKITQFICLYNLIIMKPKLFYYVLCAYI